MFAVNPPVVTCAFKLNFVHERGGSSVASFGICTGSDRADSLDCASSIAFDI